MRIARSLALCCLLLSSGAGAQFARPARTGLLTAEEITGRLRSFTPATLTADTLPLAPGDRKALRDLIAAAAIVERIYLRQNVAGGDTLPEHVAADTSAEGRLRFRYFLQNMSPWSLFDMNRSIIEGVSTRMPPGANLYPVEMNRGKWGGWIISLDPARQAEATGPRHVIRFDSAGRFMTVPYSAEYADLLSPATERLRRASAAATDAGLKKLLTALVSSFGDNDYRPSEAAAVRAGGPLSVTVGPTSLLLDNLFQYKGAFEVVIGVRNEPASKLLRAMEKLLPQIAGALGVTGAAARGATAARTALRIDDAAFIGGAARAGTVASTLRLPADTSLIAGEGTKTILLSNVHEATFNAVQKAVAAALLDSAQASLVRFDAYLPHLIMRELCGRFEPHDPWKTGAVSGSGLDRDPAPALAGAKAGAAALIALDLMIKGGSLPSVGADRTYVTRVSSLLSTLRFWGQDPASDAAAIEFNVYREQGALKYDPAGGTIRIDLPKLKESVRKLHATIGALQTRGDLNQAAMFFARYSVQPAELRGLREQLSSLPVDIAPSFPLAK